LIDLGAGLREEEEVDVGMRGQVAAPVTTDRHDCYGGRIPERLYAELLKRAVDIGRTLFGDPRAVLEPHGSPQPQVR
jgi:hypothetical protein